MADVLNGRDTISTKEAKVYIDINGNVIPLIEAKKVKIKVEKKKEEVQTLGSRWKRKKVTGIEGVGSLAGYVINSNWLKYALPYLEGESDLYFKMVVTIEDSTSKSGRQTIQIGEVNLDDIPVVDFEADDGVMEYESDFTFENLTLVEPFTRTD